MIKKITVSKQLRKSLMAIGISFSIILSSGCSSKDVKLESPSTKQEQSITDKDQIVIHHFQKEIAFIKMSPEEKAKVSAEKTKEYYNNVSDFVSGKTNVKGVYVTDISTPVVQSFKDISTFFKTYISEITPDSIKEKLPSKEEVKEATKEEWQRTKEEAKELGGQAKDLGKKGWEKVKGLLD